MFKIVKETPVHEVPVKVIKGLSQNKIYVSVCEKRVCIVTDMYNVYGKSVFGAIELGMNNTTNKNSCSDVFEELLHKVDNKLASFYEFDSLKEFAEAVIKYGWKGWN